MKIPISLTILFFSLIFAPSCGFLGGSGIFVKADGQEYSLKEKTSGVDVRKDLKEAQFVIANYDLELKEKSVLTAEKPKFPEQMKITFGLKGDGDFNNPLKPGDYKADKIRWVDVHLFKDGREKIVNLSNIQGNITISEVRDNQITGGIYVYDTDKAVRGTFVAKKISR